MLAPHKTPLQDSPAQGTYGMAPNGVAAISAALNAILADLFALYVKTKNFHWHISGPHFREYHLLLDEQGTQILATIDPVAERVRKLGGTTVRSIGHIAQLQRTPDNDADGLTASEMLMDALGDNQRLVANLRSAHAICDEYNDIATASLIENWVDEAEGRVWFLTETVR
jgi:starvation-inducible DNA-binding protein